VDPLLQEVLQRLRQRRISRLSHSQHEIEGILHCSEPSGGDISDSADELEDPAGHHPAAGPQPEMREPADQADIEDMGALANDLQDADMEEHQQLQHQQQHRQQHQQQAGTHRLCHVSIVVSSLLHVVNTLPGCLLNQILQLCSITCPLELRPLPAGDITVLQLRVCMLGSVYVSHQQLRLACVCSTGW